MTNNEVQDERLKTLKEKSQSNCDRIEWLEQHYSTFNNEMGEVKTNVKWIMKMQWWQIGVMSTGFTTLLALFLNHIVK